MGRHTDPAVVTRRATVLTLVASALLVAAGLAILRSSLDTQAPHETPKPTPTPSLGGMVSPPPSSSDPTATALPTPTTLTPTDRATVSPVRAASTPSPTTPSRAPAAAAPGPPRTTLPGNGTPRTGPGDARLAEQVVTLVNVERAKAGCRPVAPNAALRRVAENIGAGQHSAKAVMKSWMASAAHRAAIVDCRFTVIGVGHESGGSYGSYWVQDFGG